MSWGKVNRSEQARRLSLEATRAMMRPTTSDEEKRAIQKWFVVELALSALEMTSAKASRS